MNHYWQDDGEPIGSHDAKNRGIRFKRYTGPFEVGVELRVCVKHVWRVARIDAVLDRGIVEVSWPVTYGGKGERVSMRVWPGARGSLRVYSKG